MPEEIFIKSLKTFLTRRRNGAALNLRQPKGLNVAPLRRCAAEKSFYATIAVGASTT
jgi:hypothetical protein